jgi:hypothetical protein
MLKLKEILAKKQISQVELSKAMRTSTVSISAWATYQLVVQSSVP